MKEIHYEEHMYKYIFLGASRENYSFWGQKVRKINFGIIKEKTDSLL